LLLSSKVPVLGLVIVLLVLVNAAFSSGGTPHRTGDAVVELAAACVHPPRTVTASRRIYLPLKWRRDVLRYPEGDNIPADAR
jgi:hypothetical protein